MTRSLIPALAVVAVFLTSCIVPKSGSDHGGRTGSQQPGDVQCRSSGDQAPWQKYFADDAMYFDEKGRAMDKAALVKDVTPLPKGYSGSITVVNPKSHIQGDTAILSYDLNETETIFGQNMTARYHGTDTWMYRNGKWQIVAGQMFRYYEDPALGKSDARKYTEYAGTYELASGIIQTVSVRDGKLYAQRGDREENELLPESSEVFFLKGERVAGSSAETMAARSMP